MLMLRARRALCSYRAYMRQKYADSERHASRRDAIAPCAKRQPWRKRAGGAFASECGGAAARKILPVRAAVARRAARVADIYDKDLRSAYAAYVTARSCAVAHASVRVVCRALI